MVLYMVCLKGHITQGDAQRWRAGLIASTVRSTHVNVRAGVLTALLVMLLVVSVAGRSSITQAL